MLVQLSGAKQLLEIGALGGYSGICMLRGIEGVGHLTSLELEGKYALVAMRILRKQERAIRLGQPGTLIIADNTLWGDRVLDENETDASTQFLRAYNKQVAHDERLDSILIPMGDGLTIARVK